MLGPLQLENEALEVGGPVCYAIIEYRAKKKQPLNILRILKLLIERVHLETPKLLADDIWQPRGDNSEVFVVERNFDFLCFYTTLWSYRTGDPAKPKEQKRTFVESHQK